MFQYHDALLIDTKDPFRIANILKEEMECEVELWGHKTRFPVDVEVGKSWATVQEVSDLKQIQDMMNTAKKKSI